MDKHISQKKVDPAPVSTTNQDPRPGGADSSYPSRRKFLSRVGGVTAALAAGVAGVPSLLGPNEGKAQDAPGLLSECAPGCDLGPETAQARAEHALQIRIQAAALERERDIPEHPCNGDEARYADRNFFANFSKGLPHDRLGEVDPDAYCTLLKALRTGRPGDFEVIPMGCADREAYRRLVNPQAGLSFDLDGADSHHLAIPPAPAFDSAEAAGELAELYWMALARDVPFTEYDRNPLTRRAAADLSGLSDFRGPKVNGQVTTGTLFRGMTPGDLAGPFLSQFLLWSLPFGALPVVQRIRTVLPDTDYMTDYSDWLRIQRGCVPRVSDQFDPRHRYMRNGRDLGQYVHIDVLFEAYFNACLILGTPPDPVNQERYGGLGAPLNPGNPYHRSRTQDGFGTFGGPHIKSILGAVSPSSLKAVWYQKWAVHRRPRPEAFAGRVHNHKVGDATYPLHPDILEHSSVLEAINGQYGSFLLPQAFPEGSPLHPAYGAGHATVAGACVTLLKAWFDESFIIPNPVVPTADGRRLVPYTGPGADKLTLGGELNKLAANVAIGRNFAGIHWRSDYTESLRLGEAVAISLLRDHRLVYNERFTGFTFTTFDGKTVTV